MTKSELKELTEILSNKERIVTFYEQVLVTVREIVKGNDKQVTLLNCGTYDGEEFVSQIIDDIRNDVKRLREGVPSCDTNQVKSLSAELERLRHRNLWQRIFNK